MTLGKRILALQLTIILLIIIIPFTSYSIENPTEEKERILNEINEERGFQGLELLNWSEDLATAADIRAEEISRKFSHTRPNNKPWYTCNPSCCYAECLAKATQKNKENVVIAWLLSPSHSSIVLNPDYKNAGVGVYEKDKRIYVVLEMGY